MNPRPSDFIKNNNPVAIHRAQEVFDFPPFAVEHGCDSESLSKLASMAFADPSERLLPLHTKAATMWSAAYLHGDDTWGNEENKERKALVESRLDKAAKQFGITEEVGVCKDMLETLRELKKQAAVEDTTPKFALVSEDDDGATGFYPIDNTVQIAKSAGDLDADLAARKIPADWFVRASRALVKEARAQGVSDYEIPRTVLFAGTPRMPDFNAARASVVLRKSAGVSETDAELYTEIVDAAEKDFNDLLDKQASEEELLASVDKHLADWSDMDTLFKVACSGIVKPAHEVFYSGQEMADFEKLAKEVVMIGEALIPRVIVSSLSDEFITNQFGKEASATVAALKSAANKDGVAASIVASKLEPTVRASVVNELIRISV